MCGRARASATFADIAFHENIPSSNIHDYWEEENIEEVYEPFLIQQGFIMRTPRGREVTEMAYKHLGRIKGGIQPGLF